MTNSEITPAAQSPAAANHQATAAEFLDQWERAHSVDQPDYNRLAAKFAAYTGHVSLGDADAIRKALHAGRKARGWPDPKPASPGRMSIEPTIEGVIMSLWLGALRSGYRIALA
jgi:hypothetical protein